MTTGLPSFTRQRCPAEMIAGIADNKITALGVVGIVNILANQSVRFFIYMSMGLGANTCRP